MLSSRLPAICATCTEHPTELARRKVKICVPGSVVSGPEEHGVLKATGRVPEIEPYFAAADFALNPMFSGAGTNVKMADFIAARLPILTTPFGARGFELEDKKSALFFEPETFLEVLETFLDRRELEMSGEHAASLRRERPSPQQITE